MKNYIILALCLCFYLNINAQISIADARALSIGTEVEVEGIVTNGSELGIIRYLQDGTAGIAAYPGNGSVGDLPGDVQRGDIIRVRGPLKEFNNLLEIDPILEYTVLSSGNDLPDPVLAQADDINEDFEGQLMQINGATFDEGGSIFGVGNYSFEADGQRSEIYVRSNHPLLGSSIPLAKVTLTGLVSQFSSTYQLLPRDENDIVIEDNFYISSIPIQNDIEQTSFNINWTTNSAGTTAIEYGTDENLGTMLNISGETSNHSITIDNLEPATFYYVKAISEQNGVVVEAPIQVFSTASESSGEVRIYFNHDVDGNFSNGNYPNSTDPAVVEATILEMINNAQNTIDASIYNINRTTIAQALADAHNRGVRVRYIADNETANLALMNPTPPFQVIRGNQDGLMHNKFIVADAESTEDAWVLMGSMNFTDQNIAQDYNNMLLIQDESLAKAYTLEFEEMWGSSDANPGIFNVKFGPSKSNNTPHNFSINGIRMESYFSPTDNTTAKMVEVINNAQSDVNFALLTFTNNDLGNAVLNAHRDNINVRGIIDNINDTGGEYNFLAGNGVNVTPDNTSKSTHHKYCIVDAKVGNSVVITGSHNWSGGAETRNDENTLIIYDDIIANVFIQEFEARWCEVQGGSNCVTSVETVDYIEGFEYTVYPNPVTVNSQLDIKSSIRRDIQISIYDLNGRLLNTNIIRNFEGQTSRSLDLNGLSNGQYILSIVADDQLLTQQINFTK